MLSRNEVETLANELWDKATELCGSTFEGYTRESYAEMVVDQYYSKVALPLDVAMEAVKRAEAKGALRYRLTIEPEWDGPEGHFSLGSDDYDREVIQAIRDDIESGNDWAWCTVRVGCTIPGYHAEGVDWLGGCSYKDEEDFCQEGGYYEDMKAESRAALISAIAEEIVEERKRL